MAIRRVRLDPDLIFRLRQMKRVSSKTPLRRDSKRRGSAIVEVAVCFPVFLIILLGIIEFGRAMSVNQLLNSAARIGCRAAILDGSTNTSSANLQTLFRSTLIEKVGLVASVDTGNYNSQYSSAAALQTNQSGIVFSTGSQSFNSKTITFTPSGEAMLAGLPNLNTPFENKILIGLRGFRGTTEFTNNDVAVVVEGSTAIPTIYRKQ